MIEQSIATGMHSQASTATAAVAAAAAAAKYSGEYYRLLLKNIL